MKIEEYFRQIQATIDASPIVRSTRLTFEKRSSYEGYIRGELFLADETILHIREFVTVESGPDD